VTLDPAFDPDRYDPTHDPAGEAASALDPGLDPDRDRSPTLPGLLGEGAHEEERDGLEWLFGLLGVVLFLGLVTGAIYLL
jgi:hypothetical protein